MLARALLSGPALVLMLAVACGGAGDELILATTTSTEDSGLLDVLVPLFEERTGYAVKTIAVGSGAALRLGEEGEADVILAHSPGAEEEFMAAGHGANRRLVMHNDFVIAGPADDPALFNVYHVMQVDPAKSRRINADAAAAFVEFITSGEVQKVIRDFGADKYGRPLFVPDAYLESTPGARPAP